MSSFLGSTLSLPNVQIKYLCSHYYSFLLIFGLENVDDDFLLVLFGLVVSPRLQLGEDAAKLLPGPGSFGQGAESVLSIFNPTDNLIEVAIERLLDHLNNIRCKKYARIRIFKRINIKRTP